MAKKGLFIVFEGIKYSGLEEQRDLFEKYIRSNYQNSNIFPTSEPFNNGMASYKTIEKILDDEDFSDTEINNAFLENRDQHTKVIKTILGNGGVVLSKRYALSQFLNQLMQEALSYNDLKKMHNNYNIIAPDFTFFLDIDYNTYQKRRKKKKLDRFEKIPRFIQRQLDQIHPYLLERVQNPNQWSFFGEIQKINGMQSAKRIQRDIQEDFEFSCNSWILNQNL